MKNRKAFLLFVLLMVVAVCGSILAGDSPVSRVARATPYQPSCAGSDLACIAWREFRSSHPYPYQAMQGRRLKDGNLAIMIFEPPPMMTRDSLDNLIKTAFGKELREVRRLRWKIGADGWLEDIVLTVDGAQIPTDPLQDSILRDRIALLHLALFGSTFGGSLDLQGDTDSAVKEAAPNLKISPAELKRWLSDDSLGWLRLDSDDDVAPVSWRVIASQQKTGAFIAADRTMVILAFPARLLGSAQTDSNALEPLRAAFRCFAVSTDQVIGGYESSNGHLAIIGRRRTHAFPSIPPLRFETFKLIASQTADELSQSYERRSLFAGRLQSGEFRGLDWAPIFLSDALIDTELGALLNTTDQLLKSWSEAGDIEYLYFPYDKPQSFPFGQKALSTVVKETSGGTSVLYNWNTAGSAVLTANGPGKVMVTRQTGALPVTYGADAQAGRGIETGKMLMQEEQAYQYFAGRKDANLERVVQYTMIFQFCRAVVGNSLTIIPRLQELTPGITASREAASVFATRAARLLDDLQVGLIPNDPVLQRKLLVIRAAFPDLSNRQIAAVMADRFSVDARRIHDERVARLKALRSQVTNALKDYNERVARYNASLRSHRIDPGWHTDMDRRRAQIDLLKQNYRLEAEKDDPFDGARDALRDVAGKNVDREQIRSLFVARHVYEPAGAIKTPSIVVSWDSNNINMVGGHNLRARALRLEPSDSVAGMVLDETENGPVLKYNRLKSAAIEAHASELARAVEHGGVRDLAGLARIVAEPPPAPRSRAAALELPDSAGPAQTGEFWSARIGKRLYTEKSQFLDDFKLLAEKNDCCVFVIHDENEVAFAAEQNPKPPPGVSVHEIRDSPSMNEFLRGISRRASTKTAKSVVFFDTPESHVSALGINAAEAPPTSLADMAEALGQKKMGSAESKTSGIFSRDLSGRESTLKLVTGAAEARIKALLSRVSFRETSDSWTRAKVSVLDRTSAENFVADLGWQAESDGVPTAVSLKFEPLSRTGKSRPAVDVSVIAGFEESDYNSGKARLLAAHEQNLLASVARQASIAQFAMTIRNDLKAMKDVRLRRLTIVVRDGETKTVMSLQIKPVRHEHEQKRPG